MLKTKPKPPSKNQILRERMQRDAERDAAFAKRERQLKAQIRFLEGEFDSLDADYQTRCREIRSLYDTLEKARAFLRRNPPSIAGALQVIGEELDD